MSFTPRNIAQQNAERRLRHSTWAQEPVLPSWSLWIVAMFLAAFIAPLILGAV